MAVFFVTRTEQVRPESYWRPALDIYQMRNGWLLKLELAGVRSNDVRIVAQGNVIHVEGVRRDLTSDEVCRLYSMEIAYNRFERTIEMPVLLDDYEIHAEFRDGLLLLRVLHRGAQK